MFSPTCTTPMFLTLKCQPSKVSTNLTLQVNFLTHIDAAIFHTIWSRTKMLPLSLASCPHQYLQIPVLCNTSHGLPIRCEGPASSVSDARWPQWTKSNSKVVGKKQSILISSLPCWKMQNTETILGAYTILLSLCWWFAHLLKSVS